MHHKAVNLRYSKALSAPFFGEFLYSVQRSLLRSGTLHTCWVSRKARAGRELLFQEIKQRPVIFCSAWQLGQQLKPLKNKFVLEYHGEVAKNLSLTDLYTLEWAIVFSQSVSSESIRSLGTLLPLNFPIWKAYVLSVHPQLDLQCDFVKQTLEKLLQRHATVILFSHTAQKKETLKRYSADPHFIYVESATPRIFTRLPYSLRSRLISIHEALVKTKLRALERELGQLLLWCFDPDDVDILKYVPKNTPLIYDCVDYYTSIDKTLQKRIDQNQKKLLKAADLVFVNSQTLLDIHTQQRKDITLVPQGFDQDAFSSTSKVISSTDVSRFFSKLQIIRKSYQSVVAYAGALSYRVDYPNLIQLIAQSPTHLFCLPLTVLPWDTEDSQVNWQQYVEELKTLPNVIWYPRLTRLEVRKMLTKSTIGLIPYNATYAFNRFCFPMKLFEYFSVGLPILSFPIEELKHYSAFIKVGKTGKELHTLLEKLSKKEVTSVQKESMTQLCAEHAWPKKIDAILKRIILFQRNHPAEQRHS